MTPKSLALSYADHGWPVFPCRSADETDPETGEVFGVKTPLTSNGFRGATKNPRVVSVLWDRNPAALVGAPTGEPMGAWVLDIDVKPGVGNGFEWLEAMTDAHGPLPETAQASTANGGRHFYFKHVAGVRNRGGLGSCVDLRGQGGYVILPGSKCADGREYTWHDWDSDGIPPIADAPQWMLDLVLPPPAPERRSDYHYQPGGNEPYVEAAVRRELEELASAPKGGRGEAVNKSAFSLGTLVGAGAMSRNEAEAELFSAALANGVVAADGEREIRAKIRRGLDAGMRQPREIPEREGDNTRLVDIRKMVDNGLRKAAAKAGPKEDDNGRTDSDGREPELDAGSGDIGADSGGLATQEVAPPDAILATPFSWVDPSTLPRREFAYGTHYIRKYVSVTVSPGGLGKTSNSIAEALAMVSGKALLGEKPPERLRVWLFNAEDPRDEMTRRIMAAALHYKLKPEDFEGRLFLDTGRERELVIAREDKKGIKIMEPVVEAVVEQIRLNGIDVMILDPFVSTHKVNENDNGAIDTVAKLWSQIADDTNCAIDVVHHLKKVADREATVEDSRGAVSLIGAARSVRVLNRMGEDVATKAGISSEERMSYFHINQGKANLTRLSIARDWRKLESVPLGNGRGMAKPQDHAGVVTAWSMPTNEELADMVPDDVRKAVLVRFANQNYRESDQSSEWAGYVLADALGMSVDIDRKMTPEKKKAKAVLDAWVQNGTLAVVCEDDPKHVGRQIKFVRPAA